MAPATAEDRSPLVESEKREGGAKRDGIGLSCLPGLRPIVTSCEANIRAPQSEGSNHTGESGSDEDSCDSNECSTPKAEEFRIPASLQCPPAPKKRRVASRHRSAPSAGFFSPPDLDLFFPRRKISVKI